MTPVTSRERLLARAFLAALRWSYRDTGRLVTMRDLPELGNTWAQGFASDLLDMRAAFTAVVEMMPNAAKQLAKENSR